jgi:hypothetical protein
MKYLVACLVLSVVAQATLLGQVLVPGKDLLVSPDAIGGWKREYKFVRFEVLSEYPLRDSSASPAPKMPASISDLNGKRISIRGYMIPLEFGGGVSSFILVPTLDLCHFGMVGLPNQWVVVKMKGGNKTRYSVYQPITVFGTLSAGESSDSGFMGSIYRMEADAIAIHGS